MSNFFEGSGVTPTEMEFVVKRLHGIVLGMGFDDEPTGSQILGEILDLANKDKVSARDVALLAFIVGGAYAVERLNQRQAHYTAAVLADLRGESIP